MTAYTTLQHALRSHPKTWLITGVAGFIGSNLLETLLKLDQQVIDLDNFATGFDRNLDEVRGLVTFERWARFRFIRGDGETSRDFCYIDNAVKANLLAATASGEARNCVGTTYGATGLMAQHPSGEDGCAFCVGTTYGYGAHGATSQQHSA